MFMFYLFRTCNSDLYIYSFLSNPGADACIISIMHDMAECRIGDITPHCKVRNFNSGGFKVELN